MQSVLINKLQVNSMDAFCLLTPPQITKEQCVQIIEKKFGNSNYTIVNYKLSKLDGTCGFLGEHFRLTIRVKSSGVEPPIDVFCFAKFLPENPAQREFALLTGSFNKEVFAYDTLFPTITDAGIDYLATCVPQCYLVQPDYVLVLEDVRQRGFVPLARYGYLDYDHTLVIVKMLARLHAASLMLEEERSQSVGCKYRLIEQYPRQFYESFYVDEKSHKGGQGLYAGLKGLQSAVDLFPDPESSITDDEFKQRIPRACKEIFELVKPSTKFRNVLCHGDLWCTNVMMRYQNGRPSECLLLDFQIVRYLPPSHDFMAFLHLTTTREFRQRHLQDLQRIYYQELEQLVGRRGLHLPALIPYEEFDVSCQEQRRFAVVQTGTYVQMTQVKEEVMREFGGNREKWNTALYEDRSALVTESCAADPQFKAVLKDALRELRCLCEEMDV